jgi:hypothetical protein
VIDTLFFVLGLSSQIGNLYGLCIDLVYVLVCGLVYSVSCGVVCGPWSRVSSQVWTS